MKIERHHNGKRYTLSNECLKNGDEVFPIAIGRRLDSGEFILQDFNFIEHYSGFPNSPHIIKNANAKKPYNLITTNFGYSHKDKYFKIIKIEEQFIKAKSFFGGDILEWREIKIK